METYTTIPIPDSCEVARKSSCYEDDTSDSDLTSHTDSDEDFECSELEPTDDESDEEGLKNERKFIVFESMLDQLLSIAKHVVLYVRLKSPTQAVWYQSKQPVVTTIPSTGHHNHIYITSQMVIFESRQQLSLLEDLV